MNEVNVEAVDFGLELREPVETPLLRDAFALVGTADLVFTPALVARAEAIVRDAEADGITVSAFRERLRTSRKYALPLLEHFDQRGITRRNGDLRFPR